MLKYNKINTWKNEDRNSKKKNLTINILNIQSWFLPKPTVSYLHQLPSFIIYLKSVEVSPRAPFMNLFFFNRCMIYADDTQTTLKETTSQQIIINCELL